MISSVFYTLIYTPLYNGLIYLISILPGGNAGLAIVIFTIVVKIALFPLARRATKTQLILKKINPTLEEIRKKYKDNQQEQVVEMLKLYKVNNVHPLSGIIVIFIQLPIIIGLYLVFLKGGLPVIKTEYLYSFVSVPTVVEMEFLGLFNLVEKSAILAALVAATQFAVGHMTFEAPKIEGKPGESLKDDIMRSLHLQTKYMLPVLLGVFAYVFSAAVALHWLAGNLFTLCQDHFIKKHFHDIEGGQHT